MTSALVKIYALHVIEGKRTIDSVPMIFREEVENYIKKTE